MANIDSKINDIIRRSSSKTEAEDAVRSHLVGQTPPGEYKTDYTLSIIKQFGKKDKGNVDSGFVGSVAEGLDKGMSMFSPKSKYGHPSEGIAVVSDLLKNIESKGITTKILFDSMKITLGSIIEQIAKEAELHTRINESVGVTGKLSNDIRDAILQSSINAKLFGYGLEDVAQLTESIAEETGRFNVLSKEQMDKAESTARAFVGDLGDLGKTINTFEKVGIGATKAMEDINQAGLTSLGLGLRSKTTVKDISDNLSKLNEYGFKNGVQGLADMSRKATEFKMGMSDVFKIADKVMSPEGAIDLAANLQVLGGAMGDFRDPLKMMYDATNNVEGLQDALIKSAQSLATYNSEQGRFEITGVNLRRAKEMADKLGTSMGELQKSAIASQERMLGNSEMMSNIYTKGMSEEDKEFLLNMSRMDKGEIKIAVPPNIREELKLSKDTTEISLKNLTDEQKKAFLEYRDQFKGMKTSEDIARGQYSALTNIKKDTQTIVESQIIRGAKAVTSSGHGRLGMNNLTEKVSKYTYGIAKDVSQNVNLPESAIGKVQDIVNDFKKSPLFKEMVSMGDSAEKYGEKMYNSIKEGVDYLKNNITPSTNNVPPPQKQNINIFNGVDKDHPNGYFGVPTK